MHRALLLISTAVLLLTGCGHHHSEETCPTGETLCGDTCVALAEDAANCGSCGHACDDGFACTAGTCTVSCAEALDSCDGTTCIDLQTDLANCGTCGNACSTGQVCTVGECRQWTQLNAPNNLGLPDFSPSDSTLYATGASSVQQYSVANNAWTNAATGLSLVMTWYTYPAWTGGKLYLVAGTKLYTYDIGLGTSTSATIANMPATSNTQATADDAGNVYAMATNGKVIQYNPGTGALHVFDGPSDLPGTGQHPEPRLAWDSHSHKLYLGGYFVTPFYSLDPSTGTLTSLPTFPGTDSGGAAAGMSDGFCCDRHGHVYTSTYNGAGGVMWMFNVDTGAWQQIPSVPFTIGYDGACTVSQDGYLYFRGDGTMARLKVF